ncbi:MAG: peptidylprolyl isomerase [Gammaproteobacteria bacterium]|nr:peptidylprolyl isomerase [Gammaproteobacteria bacterium]MDH5730331.1 peptidylprolyl isomerase [Gammaproteobacteria bacterium]
MKRFPLELKKLSTTVLLLAFALSIFSLSASANKPEYQQKELAADVFARVGDETIPMKTFEAAYRDGIRKRFYHGKIPQAQLDAFKTEVSQNLIDQVLLIAEAKRRGISVDKQNIQAQIDVYEKRYSQSEHWKTHKASMIENLTRVFAEQDLLQKLETQVRQIPEPSEQDIKTFYQNNPALFTTPARDRLSLILLKVAPSSAGDVWQAAYEEAQQLISRLNKGADFAQLARIHSGDESASKGGDMGFLHQGMLAKPAQAVVDALQPGEVSMPVGLLSGVAIFRLDARQAAELNQLNKVAERAKQLYQRQAQENAWADLKERLRLNAAVAINSAAY